MTLELIAAAALGFSCWGLLEYTIHGLLSHRWKTFASPLHWQHHRSPRRVFTSPIASLPAALAVFALAATAVGSALAAAFVLGTLGGFARYEWLHWRIHFREPRDDRERLLRSHHLAHHFCNPRAYYGVTTRLWDRVFGTLPNGWRDDHARVAGYVPLTGPSNWSEIWNPRTAIEHVRRARHGTQ
jgi:dihydroceramide fatty acyl 2-hydroxylase